MSRLPLPLVLLFVPLLALPAGAAIVAGPERPISPATADAAAFDQSWSRIASDGENFLAVWLGPSAVQAARVSARREVLDPRPLVVGEGGIPDVAFGGGRYFVVWHSTGNRMFGRFIAPDGTMSEPVQLSEGMVAPPRVAFNGERFLVLWSAGEAASTRGVLVALDGTVLSIVDLGPGSIWAMAAGDGAFHVVKRTTQTEVTLTRVGNDGVAATPVVLDDTAHAVWNLDIAMQGDEVVIGWNSAYPAPTSPITAVTVNAAGVGSRFEADVGALRSLVSDPAGVLLVYSTGQDYARRLRSNNAIALAPLDGSSYVSDGASNGGDLLLATQVWQGGWDVSVQRAGEAELELLAKAPRHQSLPDLSTAGDVSLVVWREWIPAEQRHTLRAARVGAAGTSVPIAIDATFSWPSTESGRAGTSGSQWLVAWYEGSTIYGARVSLEGDLLDARPFVIATNALAGLQIAWDGSRYVVGFMRGQFARNNYNSTVYAARVSPSGEVEPSELTLSNQGNNQAIAAAGGAGGVLVVWCESGLSIELRGVLVAPGGTITPVALPRDSANPAPAAAWNGRTFLVAAQFGDRLRWMLVNPTGVVTHPLPTAEIPVPALGLFGTSRLQVSPLGERFLLVTRGQVAIVDPRGWSGPLEPLISDPNARISGSTLAYARSIDEAWRDVTGVFVRRLETAREPPKRRSVR